jgi:hypothetical protein
MPLSFKERKKILKNTNTLDLTPVRIHSDEKSEQGLVTIIVPKFKNEIAKKYIVPRLKSDVFKFNLDELGSAVWMNIDGEKDVQQIIRNVSSQFGDELEQSEERIIKFIFQLYEQKLISFKEIN